MIQVTCDGVHRCQCRDPRNLPGIPVSSRLMKSQMLRWGCDFGFRRCCLPGVAEAGQQCVSNFGRVGWAVSLTIFGCRMEEHHNSQLLVLMGPPVRAPKTWWSSKRRKEIW